jgi:uncharacterized membrane protein
MDGDQERYLRLEHRVRRLETRVQELNERLEVALEPEGLEVAPAPARTQAAPPPPPPPPFASAAPPPRPSPAWGAPAARPVPQRPSEPPRIPRPSAPAAPERRFDAIPAAAGPSFSIRDLEERFAGRAMAWIGGFALVAAAVFFLSIAFSRGWITEEMRVVVGLVAGAVALGVGAVSFDRRNPLLGNVLTAVGLGVVSIALFAATRAYGLVTPEIGLAGALVAAIAAAAIAIRYDVREVAAFGLIAALVAPPVMGASPTTLTLAFLAVTLVGTTAIALFRSWRWLPPIAFVLTVPQLAGWLLDGTEASPRLVALAAFALLNIVAAAGEEVRIRRDDLRPSSASLVLANGAFLLWGGHQVLAGDLAGWFGAYLALASLGHLLLGAAFLRRQGLEHLFGNLLGGTGVALLAIAAFVQLGAPVVPLAWGAEAVALAWLAVRRRHRWSALAALAVGSLAVLHIVLLEYPLDRAGLPALEPFATAWLHPAAASLAAVLACLAVAAVVTPIRWVRSALLGVGVLLVVEASTFEVQGPALAAMLVGASLAGPLLDRVLGRLGTRPGLEPVPSWSPFPWYATGAGVVAGASAVALLFATEFPPSRLGILASTPYADPATLSLALVLAGIAGWGWLAGVRGVRSALAGLGVLIVEWTLPFNLDGVAFVAAAAVLLPLAAIGDRGLGRLPAVPRLASVELPTWASSTLSGAGAVAWLIAGRYAMAQFLDPFDWGRITPPAIPFSDERALVAALLAGTAIAAARWLPTIDGRRVALLAAIVAAAVAVPFEVYADGVTILWLALALAAGRVAAGAWRGGSLADGLAVFLAGGAAVVAFAIVASPDRLWVPVSGDVRPALLAAWPVAFAALGAVLLGVSRRPRLARVRSWLEIAAAATGVYLASVAVVDVFARMAGGSTATEELAKQAQVALSVCWTAIGVAALGVGLATRRAMPRHVGFGLLALATTKVFLVDLAAMDVAYRAVVLAGLGVLLLLSAWLVTHLRGSRPETPGMSGPPPAG